MGARTRIVILGGGFAGAWCARALERQIRGLPVDVVLLDRHNYFTFHPLLIEAGTGSLEPRHAVVSIRSFLRSTAFRMGEVLGVDTAARTVSFQPEGAPAPEPVPWDHLVIALGSATRRPAVPGLARHGFEIKSLTDAVALRDHAVRMLEIAEADPDPRRRRARLRFVVVGGSFTGVEAAGEFHVFLRHASRGYARLRPDDCGMTLIEAADRILPALDADLARYALAALRRRRIDVRLGTAVRQVEAEQVVLESGEAIPTHTLIWCAGIQPPPLAASLPLPKDGSGWILCGPDLRVRGSGDVWAIGDCAVNPAPDGRPYPATAQHAVREGAHLARNLARVLRGQPARPFVHASPGALAPLGCRTAVASMFGLRLSGFPAWVLWRTVYLMKMPGWSRRLRVALDWTMDLLFRREFVQLGVHRPHPGP